VILVGTAELHGLSEGAWKMDPDDQSHGTDQQGTQTKDPSHAFPSEHALMRFARAILMDINKEWVIEGRYLSMNE
jgi:hypothetical protein